MNHDPLTFINQVLHYSVGNKSDSHKHRDQNENAPVWLEFQSDWKGWCSPFSPSLHSFFFYLPSLKESLEGLKCIPKSTSHGSFGVHTKYNRHSYTPSLSRSPQHFHRPGERSAPQSRHLRLLSFVKVLTPTAYLFPVLPPPPFASLQLLPPSLPTKPDWCFLHLYSPTTMTPAPLPLYVTTLSLTQKVRSPAPLYPSFFRIPLFYFLFSFHVSC